MTKVEAITALQRRAEALQALGATSLYLFGSVVRDEAKPANDLDLFIDYDRDGRFNGSTSSASNNTWRTNSASIST
jgi:predicted nucleotidyltransferase